MKKIKLFIALVISVMTVSHEANAQKPYISETGAYQQAQIKEMNQYLDSLTNELSREGTLWMRSPLSAGGVSGFELSEVQVESYVGPRISFETDMKARCSAEINFDEKNNQIIFFHCKIKKDGYIAEVEYNFETKELTLNNKEAVLTDQQWMIIGNICRGKYKVIK